MDTSNPPLDGNAAAGFLSEIFAIDLTNAMVTCTGCDAVAAVGKLSAYGLAMGLILRCPGCDNTLVRISRTGDGYWLDLTGSRVLRIQVSR